jgi:hypothetical protein
MVETTSAAPGAEPVEAPKMGFFERIIGIYFEPKKTFEDVHRRGSWLGVYVFVSVLAMTSSYLVISRVDRETLMRKGLQENPLTRNMSEEQIQKILSRPASPIQMYLQVILTPVGVIIAYLIVAGVLLLLFVLMGNSLTFKKSLAVTIWGMGPPSIAVLLLSIVFVLVKDPASLEIVPNNNVVTNLGPIVEQKEHPVLHSLLSSLDLISFWTIFLLAVGFSAASGSKLTTSKSAKGVLAAWGIYVLGKLAIAAMMG